MKLFARPFTITASELAKKVGYRGHRGVNGQYGKLAASIIAKINFKPLKDNLSALTTAEQRRDGNGKEEWLLTMRPVVATALELLGFV